MSMRKSNVDECGRAVRRGLDFLYRFACGPENFEAWGSDLLNWFNFISTRSGSADLQRTARKMGRERARHWRRENNSIPKDADADILFDLIYGSDSADRLGIHDRAFSSQLRRAARGFSAQDYLSFDPVTEEPPGDVSEQCECGFLNERGRKMCRQCRKRLTITTRYDVWYGALIRTYIAAGAGVSLGATYADVLKWMPKMHPYHASEDISHPDFYDTVYAVTHVVYTLNDYDTYLLRPAWLPREFKFLKANMKEALAMEDAEMVGEFMDALKSFGLSDSHPLIRAGTKYLLSQQNEDGSWGETDTEDLYLNYHPTLTALGGLLDYKWHGEGLTFPEVRPMLEQWGKVR